MFDPPNSGVGVSEARCLDEAGGGEGLASPEPLRLPSEPSLDDAESLGSNSLIHLAERGLAGGPIPVAAYVSEVRVPPESLHQILDAGDLLQLA